MDRHHSTAMTAPVVVPIGGQALHGDLGRPARARGLIVFAHGSGSSRLSPRNRYVARHFEAKGLATLLIDLLTPTEEEVDDATARLRFDIDLLAARVVGILDWLADQPDVASLPIGLFGASTGAAAALVAAAVRPREVRAVVSRGGRPDLATQALPHVIAPTLLIVGGRDHEVIGLNRAAQARMTAAVALEIVDGAGHLFEEPGALDRVAALAGDWFADHLQPTPMQTAAR